MKTSEKNLIVLGILVIIAVILIAPKGSMSFLTTAGGGINLKDMNQKDTTTTSMSAELQFNQTTEQNLEQALLIGNYYRRQNGFFIGAGFVGGVSTQYNVCCPTMYFNAGMDFNTFQLECKVGKFKRCSLMTGGIDAQYSNFCIDLGEGGSAAEAMQVSFIKSGFKFGFGHQGAESFYDISGGNWYAYSEATICKNLQMSGGVDFGDNVTGYAAAKWCSNNNTLSVTANQLGTDNHSLIMTYNRDKVELWGKQMILSASLWTQAAQKGLHLVTGIKQGKRGTLYAEIGSKFCQSSFTPYCGVGATYSF